ncbi:hypothetical protein BJY52DRAFT_923191 [Lactarius psammicola]|nr:hypothetical protein BJY52DRAFT_923191 [Lactarius psammicola]
MKRGADRQLSKDDNPDDEVEEVPTGFQMAKESDLARREIKGLPKRKNLLAQTGPPPISSTAVCPNRALFSSSLLRPARRYQPAATPKFGYFSGFGPTGGATAPFTFASSSPAGPPQEPAETSQSSAPVVTESASNATKKFASFLGPSSTAGAKPAVPSDSPKPDASGDTDEVALKYYTSLRGLNTSFLSAVSKAIDSDPFIDVVDLLEQYKKHRISVQTEYDGKSSQPTMRGAPSAASKPVSSAVPFSFGKTTTSTSATMPVPPSSFAGFPAPSATASSAASAPGTGFTPTPAASAAGSSPFGFPSVPSTSSDSKPAPVASASPFGAFAAAPSSSSSSPFKPPVSLTPKEGDPAPPSKPAFSFGASASASTTSSASPFGSSQLGSSTSLFGGPPKSSTLFGSDKPSAAEGKEKEKDKPASTGFGSAPFALSIPPGAKLFGDTSSSSSGSIFGAKSTEKDKDKEKEKDKTSSPPSSVFGATTFGSPAKPSSSPFAGFGSAAATATPSQFVFGVAAGTGAEGTPSPKAGSVGFSFGSPSRASSQTAAPAAPSSGGLGFSFAPAQPSSSGATTPASANLEVPSSTSRGDTPATEGAQEDGLARTLSPGLPGEDVEGEGEEDEETTYTVKAKVFKFTTDSEGASTWYAPSQKAQSDQRTADHPTL